MSLGLGLGFLYDSATLFGGGGSFNPISLFGSGDNGGIWDIRVSGSLWQDAGTIPATNGNPLGQIDDQSGRGNPLSASGASRGTVSSRQSVSMVEMTPTTTVYDWAFSGVTGTFWWVSELGSPQIFTLKAGSSMPFTQFIYAGFINRSLTGTEKTNLLTYLSGVVNSLTVWDFECLNTSYSNDQYYTGNPTGALFVHFSDGQSGDVSLNGSFTFMTTRVRGRYTAADPTLVAEITLDGDFGTTIAPQYDASTYTNLTHYTQYSNGMGNVDFTRLPSSVVGVDFESAGDPFQGAFVNKNLPSATFVDGYQWSTTGSINLSASTSLTSFGFGSTVFLSGVDCHGISTLTSANTNSLSVNCSNANFNGCSLGASSITALLHSLVNGGLSNGVIDISGGTNSPVKNQGGGYKTTLIGRGWTVTDNPLSPFPNATAGQVTYNYEHGNYGPSLPNFTVAIGTLTTIDVGDTGLSGAFPDLSYVTNLDHLYANACGLTSVPADMSGLTKLVYVEFNANTISGTIPLFAPVMSHIDVSENSFTATSSFASYTNINSVQVQSNSLSQVAVDSILVDLVTTGSANGLCYMDGGTNATPSATGLTAKATLVGRGWTVTNN